jgi:hypothetical protein
VIPWEGHTSASQTHVAWRRPWLRQSRHAGRSSTSTQLQKVSTGDSAAALSAALAQLQPYLQPAVSCGLLGSSFMWLLLILDCMSRRRSRQWWRCALHCCSLKPQHTACRGTRRACGGTVRRIAVGRLGACVRWRVLDRRIRRPHLRLCAIGGGVAV